MKPKRKTIWICSSCGHGNEKTSKQDAEKCCFCPECGQPTPTSMGGRTYCARCNALSDLENAKGRLESEARNFAFVSKKVQEILKLDYLPTRREIDKMLESSKATRRAIEKMFRKRR